jgi:diacylglycerol kinase (ATP)
MFKRVHAVINPAAGREQPILRVLNDVFQHAGIEWSVSITQKAGDGTRQAREAAEQKVDVVAVYGGDGTVAEVAAGLAESQVPMAILPGGTANVMSLELGIPADLAAACALLDEASARVQAVDMGRMGERRMLLRAGIGLEAAMVKGAEPDWKARVGNLAYLLSGLQSLPEYPVTRYRLTLDGEEAEGEGVTCLVANSGNLGVANVNLMPGIDVSDGLLDVVVVRRANLEVLLALATRAIGSDRDLAKHKPTMDAEEEAGPIQHWQAREITVEVDPPQPVEVDGEALGETPFQVTVIPGAVGIVVPG